MSMLNQCLGHRKQGYRLSDFKIRCGGCTALLFVVLAVAGIGVAKDSVLHDTPTTAAEAHHGRSSTTVRIGMNLPELTYWSHQWAFVDVFKQSREWRVLKPDGTIKKNPKDILTLTPEGWPILEHGQVVGTSMFRGIDGHYPAGTYLLAYGGSGDIVVKGDAREVVKLGHNRFLVHVVPRKGLFLQIDRSDRGDPVRDIRLWMPGFEGHSSPFHPLFLERLRPFKVIRFMHWQQTLAGCLTRWTERPTPRSARQSGPNGVAIEYMIALCNELDADPWFSMPHLADDEFVRNFAAMVKANLHKNAKIYVEWSNETWNQGYTVTRWAHQQAAKRAVDSTQIIAEETRRDWRIWRNVFGRERDRIVRVAAGHTHNPSFARKLLRHLDGEFDAVSCAAYVHPRKNYSQGFNQHTTAMEALLAARRYLREHRLPLMQTHATMAAEWSRRLGRKIEFVTYEGGPGFATKGRKRPYLQAYIDAQNHPMIGQVYRELLEGFRQMEGDLFVGYTYVYGSNKWGCWGHLEYQDQPLAEAIKYRTLATFGENVP